MKKAETCSCHDLLIIFYITKFLLDYKIIYIPLFIVNTMGMSHLKIDLNNKEQKARIAQYND